MGMWTFVEPNIERVLRHIGGRCDRPKYTGRPAACSTATGLMKQHLIERATFLNEALGEI